MLETHKRVIYKVCYLYASDTEHLNDLYQDTVLNLWRAYPAFRETARCLRGYTGSA